MQKDNINLVNKKSNINEKQSEIEKNSLITTENKIIENPPKLNPPHGQLFHRCEIAVGAPLP